MRVHGQIGPCHRGSQEGDGGAAPASVLLGDLVVTEAVLHRPIEVVIPWEPPFDLYSAYCRKGWGGCVRQNLPRGHANFHRRLFLTTLAIKRAEPFSRLHENRP